jgi:hypothetical protein
MIWILKILYLILHAIFPLQIIIQFHQLLNCRRVMEIVPHLCPSDNQIKNMFPGIEERILFSISFDTTEQRTDTIVLVLLTFVCQQFIFL